jgi:hypothetical protein
MRTLVHEALPINSGQRRTRDDHLLGANVMIEQDDLTEALSTLTARVFAIRDVVARLLSYETRRWENPNDMYEELLGAPGARDRDAPSTGSSSSETNIAQIFREIEGIVAIARRMGREDRK